MEEKPGVSIAYSSRKVLKGSPGLTSPSNGRIAMSSTYAFTSYALRRDLRFNQVYGTGTELAIAPRPKEKNSFY